MSIIISHHKSHLDFHAEIEHINALIPRLATRIEQVTKTDTASLDADLAGLIGELRQETYFISNNLSEYSLNISTLAKVLSQIVVEIEEQTPAFRKALVE